MKNPLQTIQDSLRRSKMRRHPQLPRVIGLSGEARVGKDTVATMLVSGYGYKPIAFADAMKLSAGHAFGIPKKDWERYRNKPHPNTGMTMRKLWQKFGQLMREQFSRTIWVDIVRRKLESDSSQRWVVTDLRQENEYEAVHAVGGLIVHLERPGRGYYEGMDHETEVFVRQCGASLSHYYIENSTTIEGLQVKVDKAMRDLTNWKGKTTWQK